MDAQLIARAARGALRLALACTAGPVLAAASTASTAPPVVLLPPSAIHRSQLTVVVNDDDPASRETGAYYAARRGLAAAQVVHVRFAPGQAVLAAAEFERVRAQVLKQQPPGTQAYALAWTLPYRVDCMSITSAFAFGFDTKFCAEGCRPTQPSPLFDAGGHDPFDEHGVRPAMLLAGASVGEVCALVDRGLRADERWPQGTAYLVSTGEAARNVRAEGYARAGAAVGAAYPVRLLDAAAFRRREDVVFAFTGQAWVEGIAGHRYLEGAVADHLTSFGGMLSGGSQTSALEWLAAGATGSFGTVVEPCNYRAKFPEPELVMKRYLLGETLLEAYWKSVRMPGQGVFVGDPLARPFGGLRVARSGTGWRVSTRALPPGRYVVEQARSGVGPYRPIGAVEFSGLGVREWALPAAADAVVRLRPLDTP